MKAAVQPVMEEMVAKYNVSFSFGFADASGSLALAKGVDDKHHGVPLRPDSMIPLGSAGKPWLAVQILTAVEHGRISLDDLASTWVDDILLKSPKVRLYQSLEDLWGPKAATVTIRDLLAMSSGFADYDDSQIFKLTMWRGEDWNLPPYIYLRSAANNGWKCDPGTCSAYSGANYVLLGVVLMRLQNTWDWEDVDQKAFIPPGLIRAGHFQRTDFAKKGSCESYQDFAHTYEAIARGNKTLIVDMSGKSCLNGWTMGNILSTGKDMALFYYDLFNNGFLNSTTLESMTQFRPLVDDWCYHNTKHSKGPCQYGLGLFRDQYLQDIFDIADYDDGLARGDETKLVGHSGANYGSGAWPCGYNKKHSFGFCLAFTSTVGLNANLDRGTNDNAMYEAPCRLYNAVLGVFNAPKLDCDFGGQGIVPEFVWRFHE